jgi:glycosyltransferase involved in cell wall biosynthesis
MSSSPHGSFPRRSRTFGFVLPRYWPGVAGGAETLVGNLARKLAGRGDQVEILTTCAQDNRTWQNLFPVGQTHEDKLSIRRFPVDPRDLETWIPIQLRINEGLLTSLDDQFDWMRESVNSVRLYEYLMEEAHRFDALFFAPYLFGTTFWGSQIAPEKSILIPCLHDESYAYLDIMRGAFQSVRGVMFNARAEQELAERLYGPLPGGVVGMGFDSLPPGVNTSEGSFFQERSPYVVYLGRKELGKNVGLLIDYFLESKESEPLLKDVRLVIVGGGDFEDLHRPAALRNKDIIDVTHVSEADKRRILQDALFLCQPSINESFSIVLMEAWQQGIPVVVHSHCEVTRQHVEEASGGLYFSDSKDFSAVLRRMLVDSLLRRDLGEAGRRYVAERYCWEAVLSRFDSVLEDIFQLKEHRGVAP